MACSINGRIDTGDSAIVGATLLFNVIIFLVQVDISAKGKSATFDTPKAPDAIHGDGVETLTADKLHGDMLELWVQVVGSFLRAPG